MGELTEALAEMEEKDYAIISRMAEKAEENAHIALGHSEAFRKRASEHAVAGDHGAAEKMRGVAAQYLCDYFYWMGHRNAYKGIAAGLALRGVVEEEIDEEGSCP